MCGCNHMTWRDLGKKYLVCMWVPGVGFTRVEPFSNRYT